MHLDAGTAIHEQPLRSRYTAVYGISAEGEAVRGRAISFLIFIHILIGGLVPGQGV